MYNGACQRETGGKPSDAAGKHRPERDETLHMEACEVDMEKILRNPYMKWLIVAALLLAMVLSMTVVAKALSDPARHQKELAVLGEKKATVLRLTGAATAAATAIAAVPGDATTPVADKLADLTSYFLIALAAVYVEEYFVTLSAYAAFFVLLPAAFLLAIIGILLKKGSFIAKSARIGIIGVVIYLVIPVSITVSGVVERTMETSVDATVEEAQEIADEINENTDEEGNILTKAWDKITGGVTGLVEKGEQVLNEFIETIAVMLVTSCVLPVGVLLFIVWLLKLLLGTQNSGHPAWAERLFKRRPHRRTREEEE